MRRNRMGKFLAFAALVGLVTVALAVPGCDDGFDYTVRVKARDSDRPIPNAEVTIDTAERAFLKATTDSKGMARIHLPSGYDDKAGRLIVEASRYKTREEEIDLSRNALPDIVLLERETASPPTPVPQPSHTPTLNPVPGPTATPSRTRTPTFTPTPTPTPCPTPTPTPCLEIERPEDGQVITQSPIRATGSFSAPSGSLIWIFVYDYPREDAGDRYYPQSPDACGAKPATQLSAHTWEVPVYFGDPGPYDIEAYLTYDDSEAAEEIRQHLLDGCKAGEYHGLTVAERTSLIEKGLRRKDSLTVNYQP